MVFVLNLNRVNKIRALIQTARVVLAVNGRCVTCDSNCNYCLFGACYECKNDYTLNND